MAHVMLPSIMNVFTFLSTFPGMFALSNMAVLCSSLFSCFPGMMLRYVLNDSEMVPAAPIITGNTSVPHSL